MRFDPGPSSARAGSPWPYMACVAGFAVTAQFGTYSAALNRLGLPVWAATLLLTSTVALRSANVHMFVMRNGRQRLRKFSPMLQRMVLRWRNPFADQTTVVINIGSGLLPLGFSIYSVMRGTIGPMQLWIASFLVAGVVQFFRLPLSVGPMVRPFVVIAPLVASVLGWALSANDQAPLAFVSGFVGILVGSDLLHVHDLNHIGKAQIVIGGDASFDAVFLNELFAMVLS